MSKLKKVRKNMLTISLVFTMLSCIGPDFPDPDPSTSDPPKTTDPTPNMPSDNFAKSVSDIIISSFEISPEFNNNIYTEISFINGTTFEGDQSVNYYKADLSSLKASYKTNAKKVTIGSINQSSGITVNDFSKELTFRFYAEDGNYLEKTTHVTNPPDSYSGLPLLVLFVEDGSEIVSRETWKSGKIIIDNQRDTSIQGYESTLEIKGRGNNSWSNPKKPYALKLTNKDPLLGMTKHKRWAALANYSDRTLLRNRVSFEIAKRTSLAWTPNSKFVELFMNGSYRGQYLLTEQIRLDANRVNIDEDAGYLIEVDRYAAEEDEYPFRPIFSDLPLKMKEPNPASDSQKDFIVDYFNQVEGLLYKEEPTTPDSLEYCNYIDIASFIDWWIVQELTGNRDSRLPGSVYMYKDKNPSDKLFAGPVWDFDISTFKGDTRFLLAEHVATGDERALWYPQLFRDPKFRAKAKEKWNGYYPTFQTIPAFIDSEAEVINRSANMNHILWSQAGLGSNGDGELDWEESVVKMKKNYSYRLERLNTLINEW